ncbi:MAG TPA: sulfatase/phosphatase domain-containing protein, partial [Planctomycetia bacterium]|nr:sulfatase/phosphatase domain-containing protein [Planctomycetia bacterium]
GWLSGGRPPESQPLDGVSMVPTFTSGGKNAPQRDLYWHFPGYLGAGRNSWRTTPAGAVRSGDFKLIEFFEDGRKELYDLRVDVSQTNDLARKHPDKVEELHAKLVAWRKSVLAPMPKPNRM